MNYKDIKNGLVVTINGNGIYSIIKFKKGSRSVVIVQDIERGEGWCPKKQKYVGVQYIDKKGKKTGWSNGKNFCYGAKYEIHVSKLDVFDLKSLPELKRVNGYAIAINWKLQYKSE